MKVGDTATINGNQYIVDEIESNGRICLFPSDYKDYNKEIKNIVGKEFKFDGDKVVVKDVKELDPKTSIAKYFITFFDENVKRNRYSYVKDMEDFNNRFESI